MSNDPFRGYDQWLGKPYEDAAHAAEQFAPYWARYGPKIRATVHKALLDTMPEAIKDRLVEILFPQIDELPEEILADWAHYLNDEIPEYETWLTR